MALKIKYVATQMKKDLSQLLHSDLQDLIKSGKIRFDPTNVYYSGIMSKLDEIATNHLIERFSDEDSDITEVKNKLDLIWNTYLVTAKATGLGDKLNPKYMYQVFGCQSFSFPLFSYQLSEVSLNNVLKKLRDKDSRFPAYEGLNQKCYTQLQKEDIEMFIRLYALKSQNFD